MQILIPAAGGLITSAIIKVLMPDKESDHYKTMEYIRKTICDVSWNAPAAGASWMLQGGKSIISGLASVAQRGVKAVVALGSAFILRKVKSDLKQESDRECFPPDIEYPDEIVCLETDHSDSPYRGYPYTRIRPWQLDMDYGFPARAARTETKTSTGKSADNTVSAPAAPYTPVTSTSVSASPDATDASTVISAVLSGSSLSAALDSQTTPMQTSQIVPVQSPALERPVTALATIEPRAPPAMACVQGPLPQSAWTSFASHVVSVAIAVPIAVVIIIGYRSLVSKRLARAQPTVVSSVPAASANAAEDVEGDVVGGGPRYRDEDLLPASSQACVCPPTPSMSSTPSTPMISATPATPATPAAPSTPTSDAYFKLPATPPTAEDVGVYLEDAFAVAHAGTHVPVDSAAGED